MLSEVSHVGSVMWSKLVKHHFPQFHASWCYSYDSGAAHAASAANPGSWINGPGEPVMGSNYLCVDSLLFAWWHSVFSKTQVEHLQQENLSTSFYWELLNRCGMCCCRATGKELYIYIRKSMTLWFRWDVGDAIDGPVALGVTRHGMAAWHSWPSATIMISSHDPRISCLATVFWRGIMYLHV